MNVKTQDTLNNPTLLLQIDQDQPLVQAAEQFLQSQFGVNQHSPDVHLINLDQTSIKIAQVRELKQLLAYHPYQAAKTIVCLLWADLATPAAQHALLKSLEEPPSHSQCILVTHHPAALLPTIQSRCVEIKVTSQAQPSESTSEDTSDFPQLDQILTASYSQSIELATSYKERPQALSLVQNLLGQLHQHPAYPDPKLVAAGQALLQTKQRLEQNINVQLALEACFFNIVAQR